MKRLVLTIEYDGTFFHGWQVQPGLRTVQLNIESALTRMMGQTIRVSASGRTDAGVHALGQVAHCDVPKRIPPENVALGLNSILPGDVRVVECRWAPEGFHSRFRATGKRYRYLILNRRKPTALLRNRVWNIRHPLDLDNMRGGAFYLIGEKDFFSFRSSGDPGTTVRDMRDISIEKDGDMVTIFFEANGFLKHMVRNIVGALVEVGRGRMEPGNLKKLLDSRSRLNAPRKAPAQGLTLMEVFYLNSPPDSLTNPVPGGR
ncbi:MAG TPA: tRNA pseudouridine(38-40) synthase TruA [Proteobacteria bacterium]|nr:tRNA pseudouridine synthase A [bacterium BMS3Abin14]HDL54025.1 tRNA pseudouridine(38-40) synthase TruA [Pseudomonadota bacterium]